MKKRVVLNITLIFLIIILTLNILPFSKITGEVVSQLNLKPKCFFENGKEIREIPIEFCCLELQSQLTCEKNLENYRCYTNENSLRKYLINKDALYYCKGEGYEIK
jgi:hypothetical protein